MNDKINSTETNNTNSNITFGIHFGALSEPIHKQLKNQGLKFDETQVKNFERQLEAITILRFSNLLPDSIATKVFDKLYKRIQTHVCKVNKLKIVKN